jgi:hypothetical protein
VTKLDASLRFEQGPIRPPSEARSLLMRVTRNCSWNKCSFCPVYKGTEFSRRSLEEIKSDIDAAALMREQIESLSNDLGMGGKVDDKVISAIFSNPRLSNSFRNVAAWLYYGTGAVFLQDANNLVMKPQVLAEALEYLREKMPGIKRITTYARSGSAALRSLDELKMLRKAGLDRVHIGLETGYDPLLKFMKKGVTAAKQVEGGKKVKEAGMELSEYVMPGLGGVKWWKEHAIHTARVLNQINPDFIRLRTLRVPHHLELRREMEKGAFELLTEDGVVEEIKLFVQTLDGITSYFASDHIGNLIETVEGSFPNDKQKMLEVLDSYIDMPDKDRLMYRICRRMGRCRDPRDIQHPGLRAQMEPLADKMIAQGDPEGSIRKMIEGKYFNSPISPAESGFRRTSGPHFKGRIQAHFPALRMGHFIGQNHGFEALKC